MDEKDLFVTLDLSEYQDKNMVSFSEREGWGLGNCFISQVYKCWNNFYFILTSSALEGLVNFAGHDLSCFSPMHLK